MRDRLPVRAAESVTGDVVALAQLPATFARHLPRFAAHWQADPHADARVLASLWTKPLAARIAGTVAVVHALTGDALAVGAEAPAIAFDRVGRAQALVLPVGEAAPGAAGASGGSARAA
ncbi:MAG: hypothetical protein ACLFUG_09815, partial [Nitriliruptoraceae bacterium]